MRSTAFLAVLVFSAVAMGRSSVRASFRGRTGGPCRGGGLTVRYHRRTSHSSLCIRFRAAGCAIGGHTRSYRYSGGGSAGLFHSVGSRGGVVSQGGHPLSPLLCRAEGTVSPRPRSSASGLYLGSSVGVAVGAPSGPSQEPRGTQESGLGTLDLVDAGDRWFARGEFALAVASYRRACDLAPEEPAPAFALGHGLLALGDYRAAAAALRRGLRRFPGAVAVKLDLRRVYGDRRLYAAHVRRLRRFLDARPTERSARFLLAYVCYFTGQGEESRMHFERLGEADAEARLFLNATR